MAQHVCPCCGYLTLPEPPDSQGICPICYWQDEVDGSIYAADVMGPNKVSLLEAQSNFAQYGTCDVRLPRAIRSSVEYLRDPLWRQINLMVDGFKRFGIPNSYIGNTDFVRSCDERIEQPYYWLDGVHAGHGHL